jgi:uncharacterized protein YicC (UPF0701 family)
MREDDLMVRRRVRITHRSHSLPMMTDRYVRARRRVLSRLGTLMWTLPALMTAVLLLAGCQQQREEPPDERRARLLAAENAEMQQQMTARQAENQALQQEYTKELRQRDEELATCKARVAELQKDLEEGIAERVRSVTAAVVDENARLRQEVEALTAEIARLKTRVERQTVERERLIGEIERLEIEIERLTEEAETR